MSISKQTYQIERQIEFYDQKIPEYETLHLECLKEIKNNQGEKFDLEQKIKKNSNLRKLQMNQLLALNDDIEQTIMIINQIQNCQIQNKSIQSQKNLDDSLNLNKSLQSKKNLDDTSFINKSIQSRKNLDESELNTTIQSVINYKDRIGSDYYINSYQQNILIDEQDHIQEKKEDKMCGTSKDVCKVCLIF